MCSIRHGNPVNELLMRLNCIRKSALKETLFILVVILINTEIQQRHGTELGSNGTVFSCCFLKDMPL